MTEDYPHPELLAETDWLAERLADPALRIVDCDRIEAYRWAHIPGAVPIASIGAQPARAFGPSQGVPDTPDSYWKDPQSPAHVLPPALFARAMAAMGIGDDTLVVAYDGHGGHYAARLWWVLGYYGHERVKLLNGGWVKWLREGRPFTHSEESRYPTASFTARGPRREILASFEDVAASLGDPQRLLLDVRSDGEWTAAEPRTDARRGGRIPGAVHLEWVNCIDWERDSVFKPAEELRALLQAVGVAPDREVTTY